MKRIILFVLGLALAFSASAQTWQDALLFSENNYSGSARGVGMGNALSAVGGDVGSLVFNPAGSAVAPYSQFVITPGFTFSVANVKASEGMSSSPLMGDPTQTAYGRMKLPNLGLILSMDTGRRSGLKRTSFGIVFNSTNNFTGRFNAVGPNDDNSYAASLASSADGYAESVLANENWYYSGDPSRMPAWVDMAGFRGGMFNAVNGMNGAYVALTEIMDADGNFRLAAPIYQRYGQQTYGSKHDAILNFALNFSDRFYIGANVGVSVLRYYMNEYWYEAPQDPDQFPTIKYSDGSSARFESLRMKHNYRLDGSGIYLKVGALWRPVAGLRLAAAVQTPTILNLTERYGYTAEVNLSGKYVGPASSPEDQWIYALRVPMRANAGLAYTFGNLGMVSVDYEYTNYASALFKSRTEDNEYGVGDFYNVNQDIRSCLTAAHQIRVGTEIKATEQLSLRAGYNLTTGAQLCYERLFKHSASVGFGVNWGGIFLDAALRARFIPKEYFIPYNYYYAPDASKYYYKEVDDGILTPEVVVKSTLFDALVTLGWRF